ncbi:MAG TPA: hypothetical protein VL461_03585 [Dictyobacter sp.]|jgi:hypothetical protein|nr:hypothetical protein [Dictyobacter sp.]
MMSEHCNDEAQHVGTPVLEQVHDVPSVRIASAGQQHLPAILLRFLGDHFWLLLFGLCSEGFYLCYLVRQFPLVTHVQELADMGYLSGYSHRGFLAFMLCFSALFGLFLLAWREATRHQQRETLWLILGFGATFALTNIFVYPINAVDMYGYIAESAELFYHHANPLIVAASHYPNDPLIHVAVSFVGGPAPYGPLGIVIDSIPTMVSGHNLLLNMLLLKAFFALFMLTEAYLLYQILLLVKPDLAIAGALAFVWNPYVLLEYVANCHNDIVMMFFVLLALYAVLKGHHTFALFFILLSAFVKYSSLPLIPLFYVYSLTNQATIAQRLTYFWRAIVVFFGVILILFAPFWAGSQTLASAFNTSQFRLFSFSMLLSDMGVGGSKYAGIVIFGMCYLYALWLVVRSKPDLILACFLTMLALLAFAMDYVQAWYLLWPCLLAVLRPRLRISVTMVLLSYAATMIELVHAYFWPWGAYQNASVYAIVNSVVYLVLFGPSIFLLVGCILNDRMMRWRRLSLSQSIWPWHAHIN